MNEFTQKFARFLSVFFHPLIMPTYGVIMLITSHPKLNLFIPDEYKIRLYVIVFSFTCLLPIINIFLMYAMKFISSIYFENKEERRVLYFTTIIFYFAAYYIIKQQQVLLLVEKMLLGATFALIITFIINWFWKISAHMVGIGGSCMAMFLLSSKINVMVSLPLLLLLAGLMGASRLILNAHTPWQVYCGFIVGIAAMIAGFYIPMPF